MDNDDNHFLLVKQALERNYYCLRVTCDDVGGLVDMYGEYRSAPTTSGGPAYLPNAEACIDSERESPPPTMNNNPSNREPVVQPARRPTARPTLGPLTRRPTQPPPSPPVLSSSSSSSSYSSPYSDHHARNIPVPIQIGIIIGLLFVMFCITLLCNCYWRTPPPSYPPLGVDGLDNVIT